MRLRALVLPCLLAATLWAAPCPASGEELSAGQLVYVPAYAHIYHGTQSKPFYLTVTLSVRNVDPGRPLVVTAIDYYDTKGKLITRYLDKPRVLVPLETMEVIVRERGEAGGSGDNFLVRWQSEAPMNPPLVEAVMIGTASAQGISFSSRGVVLQE